MANLKQKKLNNAETIRLLLDIEKKHLEENEEDEVFTPAFRQAMEEILEKGKNPDGTYNDVYINALLQKKLKPVPAIKI